MVVLAAEPTHEIRSEEEAHTSKHRATRVETVFNRARMQVSSDSGGAKAPSVTSSLTENLLL